MSTPKQAGSRRQRGAANDVSAPTLSDIRKWPATVSIDQAATALGCGRTYLYDAIRRGDAPVKTIPLGRFRVVITADLVRLLSGEDREAS
ncbi:DNA-binding protein [Streptomyces sp. NBC_01264]|uniref:DNA-binding protein n=1 Tax=Streptomyces sp. NBC_01264 TaxID=2903804 RepID=UPI002258A93A|nr:DNA-binding protein [Streptomyces sp. NBC_01264]MCX4780914.1 DNA-binding protein [Streptomyces sp. NBC_01264]